MDNGWPEWQKAVLYRLDTIDRQLTNINAQQTKQAVEIGQLKVKAGAWGFVAGAVATLGAILIKAIT